MLGKLVLTPRQSRMARRIVVKAFFNAALQVLGPKAHRKRLCLQSKTRAVQHFKCILHLVITSNCSIPVSNFTFYYMGI